MLIRTRKIDDTTDVGTDSESDLEYEQADDELASVESVDESGVRHCHRWVRNEVETMYAQRYEMSRRTLPRGPAYLHHVLGTLKNDCSDHFREALRISPGTFDKIIDLIMHDPVFSNNSNHPQIPIEMQLAIALYQFGHDGNSTSLQSVANWASVSQGMVHLITHWVMTAILRLEFKKLAVHFPTASEKEKAKDRKSVV